MSFDVVETTLGSAVADAATFTVAYPANRDSGDYLGARDNIAHSAEYGSITAGFSFDATVVTITNNSGVTLAAGTKFWIQLDRIGRDDASKSVADEGKMTPAGMYVVNLGAPDVADANGVIVSQNLTAAGVFSISTTAAAAIAAGALAGTFDVPRNVVAAWTTTAVLTVTGTDIYGNTIVESSASGATMTGKKAFKTITNVETSVDITALTVGTGDVLGLPVFLPATGYVIKELEDDAAPTAGTVVAGVLTAATATTGDVRGTYDPNSAADGAKAFKLIMALPDPSDVGIAQFAG